MNRYIYNSIFQKMTDAGDGKSAGCTIDFGPHFRDHFHFINMNFYNIFHFDSCEIEGRKYSFRCAEGQSYMTVVCPYFDKHCLLHSLPTSGEHKKVLEELHRYILRREGKI